jgi:alkylation response protein AidB-like acyl-CoA dehydrogenase
MDFELNPEELAFEGELEGFLQAEITPDVADGQPEQLSQTVDTPAKRAFMRKLAERGWLGISWPAVYGGRDMSGIYDFILTEALSRYGAPQPGKGVGIVGKTIIRRGSEKMKKEFLPQIIRGEIEFAIGYSEPNAGSDAANMQLEAEKVAGGWVLNGHKTWTTSAHFADWYWLGARTSKEHKHKGITLFLIEMDHTGLEIAPIWTIGDERTNEVFFNDVFVSDDHVVGEVNQGFTYISEALDLERFAMMPVGPLEMKAEALFEYVRIATRDGKPLKGDRVVRARIARLAADLEVSRMLQRRVICGALAGGIPTVAASQYKLFMNESGQRLADAAQDILGPQAQLRSGEDGAPIGGRFERSYRYTVVDTIGGGTSEIQKNIIARRGLGLPRNF